MKKLLIVESPAKIKTIKKFLDDDFVIMSTMGHIKDLPTKELGVTVNGGVHITYVPIKDKDKLIADLCKAAQKVDEIYLAPDPDREGEIIAWHAAQEINKVLKKNAKIYRISFNEITKEAILEAVQHPGEINEPMVNAQQARRVLDRWVGYEVSPVLWKKIAPGLSAGRVQSVALRLICDRENEIRIFKPEEYWSIEGIFKHEQDSVAAMLTHINKKKAEISEKKVADKIIQELKNESFVIESITDKNRIKNPLPPFMTSTIQQAAYNRLGFSVKKTMQLAQQLYEGIPLEDPKSPTALITYMRTDSLRIADSALTQVRAFINGKFSKEYLPSKANVFEKKSAGKVQDAHEAIRPINVNITPEKVYKYVTKDLARLYELIWQRFVACQMKAAIYAQRQVVIEGQKYTFKVTGSTLIFDGFLKVYGVDEEDKESKVVIPADLKAKNPLDLTKINPKQHFTQPPARYSEATLVKELEKEGIGRPSTYAAILNTIRARSYTNLDEKKRFVPTELGMTVTETLVKNLPKIMDLKFTANMEKDLDKIASNELDRDQLLTSFYTEFQNDLTAFRGTDGKKKELIPTDITCPECQKEKLVIRFGKGGEFVGCAKYPACTFTSNFKRNEQGEIELIEAEKPKLLEEVCPNCGKQLRQIKGKFGMFVACSGYPECKYIHQEKAGLACPSCKKGELIRRSWRGGKFWGCNNYPTCKFAVFADIENKKCPKCGAPFLTKKTSKDGQTTYLCYDKTCGYKTGE